MLLELEVVALELLVLMLTLGETIQIFVELCFEVLNFCFEFGFREAKELVGFDQVVDAFLLFLVKNLILLEFEAGLLFFRAKVLEFVLESASHERV